MSLKSRIAWLAILMILTGIFTFIPFRILPSIGIVLLTVTAVTFFTSVNQIKNSSFLFPAGIFLLYLANAVFTQTGNEGILVNILLLKIPFLLLPLAFMLLPQISLKQLQDYYFYFFILTIITAIGTLGYFALHFREIIESYKASKIMPTPVSHVRYSLIIAFSIFAGIYLYFNKLSYRFKYEKQFILAGTIFLILFIHILSVRSGLAAFYLIVAAAIIFMSWQKKWYWQGLTGICLMLLIPVVSYFAVPTFRNKISNTIEDLGKLGNTADANNYSLAGRVVSYKVAFRIIGENLLLGTGAANLEQKVKEVYRAEFPEIHEEGLGYLMPHNQFLVVTAATGLTGLVIFLICFYAPLFINRNYRFPLLLVHYAIITVSFLFEGTLETQTGTNFTAIFIFLPLAFLKNPEKNAAHA
jgi:O-antigen ligase